MKNSHRRRRALLFFIRLYFSNCCDNLWKFLNVRTHFNKVQNFPAWLLHSYSGMHHTRPNIWKRMNRRFLPIFEVVDIFRQIPCFSADPSFLSESYFLCSVLKFWNTRIAFLMLAFLTKLNYLRWTFFFPEMLCNVPSRVLGEQDCDLIQFPSFSVQKTLWFCTLEHATQFCKPLQWNDQSFSSTVLRLFWSDHLDSMCLNKHLSPNLHPGTDLLIF